MSKNPNEIARDHFRKHRAPFSRFAIPEVLAIRRDPRPLDQIAADYGCSKSTIRNIKTRYTYSEIADLEGDVVVTNPVGRPVLATPAQIERIKASAKSVKALASELGLSPATVADIRATLADDDDAYAPGRDPSDRDDYLIARVDGKPVTVRSLRGKVPESSLAKFKADKSSVIAMDNEIFEKRRRRAHELSKPLDTSTS